jgi:colanic acid/amylovoran biosynthesis glycosyltransferase
MINGDYNLCIIKPNKASFSETFIQEHIDRLAGHKFVLYGGAFPVYDDKGKFLIKSKLGLLSYLIQKKLFKRQRIEVRINALKNYLADKKIDAVFAEYGTVGAMVTEACKLAGVPLIIHFHGADVYYHKNVEEYSTLYQEAFGYASAFIAVSADMAKRLEEMGAPADKIYNASCGVDPGSFVQLDIANSGPNFLAVGRFVEKKSPQSLVKAFKLVVDKFPDAKLWMVGDGPLFGQTKVLISQLSLQQHVMLTGVLKSEQIKEMMKSMRGFVQHSVIAPNGDSEGTPVTILEASSSGLPVVSTRHAGIKEAVVDGVTGFLTDEHDIEGMANGIIQLAASMELAVKMGKAGREHMIENYDIKNRIKLLDSVIKSSIKHS